MDDWLQTLHHLYEKDTEIRKHLLDLIACIEFNGVQNFYDCLKSRWFHACTYNPTFTEFCDSHFLIPSGSVEEGSLLSRFFGQRCDWMDPHTDKIELEFDMMWPVGEVSSAQLIPCHQLGYFAIKGSLNLKPLIPNVYKHFDGFETCFNVLFSAYYSKRGYFSIAELQDKGVDGLLNIKKRMYFFRLLGLADDQRFVSTPNINGPSVCWTMQWIEQNHSTLKSINIDSVFCVFLKIWPDVANEWIHRERASLWPTKRTVDEITTKGCLLVAKYPLLNHSQEQCDAEPETHWRLSFSLAEIRLSKERSKRHNYCYFVFKSLFYFKFSELINRQEMSSYLAKTVFLWKCESLDFGEHEIIEIIIDLFQSFKQCLVDSFLPHYFIRSINLVENISETSRKLILDIISDAIKKLVRRDTCLTMEMLKMTNTLLTLTQPISHIFKSCAWISFCWDSVCQKDLVYMDKLPRFQRIIKISSDTSMTGFIKLVAYIERKFSCITGIIQLITYLFPVSRNYSESN